MNQPLYDPVGGQEGPLRVTHPRLQECLEETIVWLQEMRPEGDADTVTVATQGQACKDTIEALQEAIGRISKIRRVAITMLWDKGWSQREIARAYGLSPARIGQIVSQI